MRIQLNGESYMKYQRLTFDILPLAFDDNYSVVVSIKRRWGYGKDEVVDDTETFDFKSLKSALEFIVKKSVVYGENSAYATTRSVHGNLMGNGRDLPPSLRGS